MRLRTVRAAGLKETGRTRLINNDILCATRAEKRDARRENPGGKSTESQAKAIWARAILMRPRSDGSKR